MRCKSCLREKPESDFYTSNKTKCKECIKASVRENRLAKLEYYREFDRKRGSNPERVSARKAYSQTLEGKQAHARATEKWRVSNALRRKAHNKVNAAVRDGRLKPEPCFVCGDKAQAHHPDYGRPLDVVWLCPEPHKEAHRTTAEILQATGQRDTMHY